MLAPRAARARPRRTAPSRRRRSGPRVYLAGRASAELRERLAARLRVGAIDDQRAVEVVELVLDDPRRQTLELELHRLAARVRPSIVTSGGRSTGTRTGPSERQPSSSTSVSPPASAITGLTSTCPRRRRWKTKRRRRMPTCVAASPTPSASCISADHALGQPRELLVEASRPRSRASAAPGRRTGAPARARTGVARASRPRARRLVVVVTRVPWSWS